MITVTRTDLLRAAGAARRLGDTHQEMAGGMLGRRHPDDTRWRMARELAIEGRSDELEARALHAEAGAL